MAEGRPALVGALRRRLVHASSLGGARPKATVRDGLKFVSAVAPVDDQEALRSLGSQVLGLLGEGVVQLGATYGDKASLVAFCSPAAIKAGHAAGKIVQTIAAQIGGKGGGKPDFAMGGGKDIGKLAEIMSA